MLNQPRPKRVRIPVDMTAFSVSAQALLDRPGIKRTKIITDAVDIYETIINILEAQNIEVTPAKIIDLIKGKLIVRDCTTVQKVQVPSNESKTIQTQISPKSHFADQKQNRKNTDTEISTDNIDSQDDLQFVANFMNGLCVSSDNLNKNKQKEKNP